VKLKYLLDTNVVSEGALERPNSRILEKLKEKAASCAIAAPVWHELMYGVLRLPRGKRRAVLEAYLSEVVRRAFPILPYDEGAAEWHAGERARLEKLGKMAAFVDGQIAAIAFVNGLQVVTENMKDFRGFKGVGVTNWR
jgi:tRNA(fMet)-specific endonuclease VapC